MKGLLLTLTVILTFGCAGVDKKKASAQGENLGSETPNIPPSTQDTQEKKEDQKPKESVSEDTSTPSDQAPVDPIGLKLFDSKGNEIGKVTALEGEGYVVQTVDLMAVVIHPDKDVFERIGAPDRKFTVFYSLKPSEPEMRVRGFTKERVSPFLYWNDPSLILEGKKQQKMGTHDSAREHPSTWEINLEGGKGELIEKSDSFKFWYDISRYTPPYPYPLKLPLTLK